MALPLINLAPFGMRWTLNPATSVVLPPGFQSLLNPFVSVAGKFISGSGATYSVEESLGKGSYGEVFLCKRSTDSKQVAVKVVKTNNLENDISEVIIQTLVYLFTKDIKHPEIKFEGPYCPAVYEIGFDKSQGKLIIVNEVMRATTFKFLEDRKGEKEELRTLVPTILCQVSTMLIDLYRIFRFNHRDFKTDNIMYIRNYKGYPQMRLIDFGFSCVNIGNLQVSGGSGTFKYCSLASRDLTQVMFELFKYHKYLPVEIKDVLKSMLTFKVGPKVCEMYTECDNMKDWKDTYDFLNTDVTNPNGIPEVVFNVMATYLQKGDWRAHLAYVPHVSPVLPKEKPAVPIICSKGKVHNPNTNRCVKAEGQLGKALIAAAASATNKRVASALIAIKHCSKGRPNYNPLTKRCVKSCPKGRKRNSTFKCKRAATI
jgi:hypothetical protein